MNENVTKAGYVYVLEVKDIVLPVCKIGMTTRNPAERCSEINNNSTGDFIWKVAYQIFVNDCKKLESLVHNNLHFLRQKNREFFNINAKAAYDLILSVINTHSDILTNMNDLDNLQVTDSKTFKNRQNNLLKFRKIDAEYTELLQTFNALLGVKGRPFGQLNKPLFGMCDGNEGVQWNLVILTDIGEIRLGVNLEGLKYRNWPIVTFIQNELENPNIENLKNELSNPELLYIRFMRDAWQVTSRPNIVEKLLGGNQFSISEMDNELWTAILKEALECLDIHKRYRGRKIQTVTLETKPKNSEQIRDMEVSPHLTIWTPIDLTGNITSKLKTGFELLKPVYTWVRKVSN